MKKFFVIPAVLLSVGLALQTEKVSAETVEQSQETTVNKVATITPQQFVGKVNYQGHGKVNIWQINAGKLNFEGKRVSHGESYKVFGFIELAGMKYYNLGGNQWIQGQYLLDTTNKPVTVPNQPDSETPQIPEEQTKPVEITKDEFIGQISYRVGGKVNVWQINDGKLAYSGKQLPHGSHYKVFSYTTLNGKKYFNLGGNQWVESTYIKNTNGSSNVGGSSLNAVTNEATEVKPGTTLSVVAYQTKAGILVYQQNTDGSMQGIANKFLANGSSWKVFKKTAQNGETYYNVGGNQWVPSKYVVLTNPTRNSIEMNVGWVSQYSPIMAPWGCASAALAMLMSHDGFKVTKDSLKYMQDNLPMYNTTPGGQKGNVYTGQGFGYVINANALTNYGHKWSNKVRNISGINAEGIKKLVLGGHPVLYFGWSSYQNLKADTNRNHCKVIIGYKDGKFLVLDPLYWPGRTAAGQGGTRETGINNGYDMGAKHWTTISHFNREFSGNALTI